jgi:hypothetical protein
MARPLGLLVLSVDLAPVRRTQRLVGSAAWSLGPIILLLWRCTGG